MFGHWLKMLIKGQRPLIVQGWGMGGCEWHGLSFLPEAFPVELSSSQGRLQSKAALVKWCLCCSLSHRKLGATQRRCLEQSPKQPGPLFLSLTILVFIFSNLNAQIRLGMTFSMGCLLDRTHFPCHPQGLDPAFWCQATMVYHNDPTPQALSHLPPPQMSGIFSNHHWGTCSDWFPQSRPSSWLGGGSQLWQGLRVRSWAREMEQEMSRDLKDSGCMKQSGRSQWDGDTGAHLLPARAGEARRKERPGGRWREGEAGQMKESQDWPSSPA